LCLDNAFALIERHPNSIHEPVGHSPELEMYLRNSRNWADRL
jgi:hypothetical protein